MKDKKNILASESINERDLTVGTSCNNTVINESMVNMKTLERCSNERIVREMSNFRHLNHSHHVLIANGQTILQKKFGVVPMEQIDPKGSNRSIPQTIEITGKNREM